MTEREVREYIHREKRNTHSVEDQVTLSHSLWDQREVPSSEGLTRREIEDELEPELDHSVKTCLRHLEEINIVEEFQSQGPETLVIADWDDKGIVNGSVDETADEGIEALIDHVQNEDPTPGDDTTAVADGVGVTLRQVVAEQFDLEGDSLEGYLRTGDQVDKLNAAVEAIEEDDEFTTREDYDRLVFINQPLRYRLTEFAVDRYRS